MSALAGFVDRRQVCQNFRRAAGVYASADFLSREVDGRMQERLDYVRLDPALILDLGCGPGLSLKGLQQRYPRSRCLGVDLVPAMLPAPVLTTGWRRWFSTGVGNNCQFLAADAGVLPLKAGVSELVWSNLLLPWLEDPRLLFAESHRVLQVGGLLMFSTLGPDTLKELRSAFSDGYTHLQRFTDMHDLGDMLVEAGFSDPVVDMEVLTLTYEHLDTLLDDLRRSGATCAMTARRRGLSGRGSWDEVRRKYEQFRKQGRLPATFEIVYGHGWKPEPRQIADGRAIIRFDRKP